MKKYGVILMLAIMICVIGCGNGESNIDSIEGDSNVNVTDEKVSVSNDESKNGNFEEELIEFPEIEYEEWIVDTDNNKLFGYNLPLGWKSEKGNVGKGYVPVSLKINDSESELSDLTIVCATDEWMTWYETETAPAFMQNNESVFNLEKTINTTYGECKIFYERMNEEPNVGSVSGLIKLDDKWCVWFHSYASWAGLSAAGQFLEDHIYILTSEKQSAIEVDYEYPNWFTDDNGSKLIGFNTPMGMKRMDDDTAVCLQDGSRYVRILDTDYNLAYKIMTGGDEESVYTQKSEVETVYGTAKIYDVKLTWGGYETYLEEAVLCVNGAYILIQYSDYSVDGYVNKLEEIITNQLFLQE